LLVALVLGVVARLVWVALAARRPEQFGDPFAYLAHAEDLAEGRGYVTYFFARPTAYYPPGYPGVLGALLWLARLGRGSTTAFEVAITLNVVVGAATVVLTHHAARLVAGARAAAVAAVAVAVWPGLVLYTATAHLEPVFVALVALVLVLLARLPVDRPPALVALATLGVALGAAVLVRPIVAPAALLVAVAAWRRGRRAVARDVAVTALAMAAVVAPWSIRSTAAMDSFVLVSTNTGDNLCVGHSDFSNGGYLDLGTHCWVGYDDVPADRLEIEHDRRGTRNAVRYALDHPGREVTLLAKKAWRLVEHDHEGLLAVESYGADRFLDGWLRTAARVKADAWWVLSAPFVLAGAVVLWRRGDPAGRAALLLGSLLLAVPLVFFGGSRFHVPAVPVFALCAGVAVDRLLAGRSNVRPGR
jgi:4-amino-4-deoxy-L-arabinose transferase-like glycosyltransferase